MRFQVMPVRRQRGVAYVLLYMKLFHKILNTLYATQHMRKATITDQYIDGLSVSAIGDNLL